MKTYTHNELADIRANLANPTCPTCGGSVSAEDLGLRPLLQGQKTANPALKWIRVRCDRCGREGEYPA